MLTSAEIALLAGVGGFYLVDTLAMLYSDEVVLVQRRRGWQAVLGSEATFSGRYPALPALLAPGAGVLRMRWGHAAVGAADVAALHASLARATPLRWPARIMAALLLGVLPVALLVDVTSNALLVLLAAIYVTSIGAVAYLIRHRRAFALTRGALASIALDVIACPPFAINLVRRLTLRLAHDMPPEQLAAAVLEPHACERVFAQARRRLALAGIDNPLLAATPEPTHVGVAPR